MLVKNLGRNRKTLKRNQQSHNQERMYGCFSINSKPEDLENSSDVRKSDEDTQYDLAWKDAFNSITEINGDDVCENINIIEKSVSFFYNREVY
jgi:hypothetical protein